MAGRIFHYVFLYPLLLLVAGTALLLAWLDMRSPLAALPPPQHGLSADQTVPVVEQGRRLEHITLAGGALGDIGITVNLPDPSPAKKLPILIVLGGLGTGENNIRLIDNIGDNAVIGYDWPMPMDFPKGRDLLLQTPDLYHRVMMVPGQVASVIGWLATQPWADDKRISVLGFSLGALATPAAENLTEHDGHPIGWTIIAYGGAPFGALFASNPHMKPKWMGPVVDVLLHPLQPTVNLPYLSSHFLVLEGRDDALIPAEARAALSDAVPGSKDVVVFGGDHMGVGPDKQALLGQIIRTSRGWLIRNGAVNPPPAP
jgi:hypothetical protein